MEPWRRTQGDVEGIVLLIDILQCCAMGVRNPVLIEIVAFFQGLIFLRKSTFF
jgi:hypothetical protein